MKPRIGFLGTGWIGRHRMAAMVAAQGVDGAAIDAVAVCDPSEQCVDEALAVAPSAKVVDSLDAMLALDLDGVVIATPSALHADQSIQALSAGTAVFCQKPLGRTAAEVDAVIAAARAADRLLGVDLSYRHTAGMEAIAGLVREGTLGEIFAVDLTFHNAYGPDKPWFYDPAQSGGGCVVDLGVHLVDLALWTLGFPQVSNANAALYAGGQPLHPGSVEDYATASFDAGGTNVRLACSWRLHAGQDAVIAADFYGTQGGAALRNVNGSFYDFTADHFTGTHATRLTEGADDWGGRAAADWATRFAQSPRYDEAADHYARSAQVLDLIYGR
jgi:predicted dehydrogenase